MKALHISPVGTVISVGSIKLDYTLLLGSDLHGRTVRAGNWLVSPGGKAANQAVASARAGATVRMIGSVGDDQPGHQLLTFLAANRIEVGQVLLSKQLPTGSSVVLVTGDGDNSIMRFPGATALLDATTVKNLDIKKGDVLIAQLGTPLSALTAALHASRIAGATSILNATTTVRHVPRLLSLASIIVLNEQELAWHSHRKSSDLASDAAISAAVLSLQQPGQIVVATLGEKGAVAATHDGLLRLPGYQVEPVDTTGAGDCFIGNLAASIAAGARIESGLYTANIAAALSVQRPGAAIAMPYQHETVAAHLVSSDMVQTA